MITLCLDTSHIFLVIALIKDERVVAAYEKQCPKKQSEELFVRLREVMKKAGLEPDDIDQVVVTKGPGSYTGVRMALTLAKVFCALKEKKLFTIDTLSLYAGKRDCRVVLDARGGRVYTARFRGGRPLEVTGIIPVKDLPKEDEEIIGDGRLLCKDDIYPDFAANFLALQDIWQKAANVHLVAPEYLKPKESYLVKKC